ncbi:cysteine hydrolase family protein [Streptomyces venezuelae]|uniref:cysteine hydrolase family protein n=1 Tax=Streptomyces venezuelae TaxID=54571 RepID=UPI001F1E118B|nr:isochorismatase family cysteine hydrolase [Streptomyces venezuelae]
MPTLDTGRTALVLVDLMERIVALPLAPRPGTDVLAAAARLADTFRAAGAPVVHIRVERPNVEAQPPGSDLVPDLVRDGEPVVVKRTIGGFQDTGLHELLTGFGATTLVFGGIATNLGVESTARAAAGAVPGPAPCHGRPSDTGESWWFTSPVTHQSLARLGNSCRTIEPPRGSRV